MADFDVSLGWTILFPPAVPAARKGGEELAGALAALRKHAGLTMEAPVLADGSGTAPEGPIIVLNAAPETGRRNGFSWRLGADRLEIYGDSGRGLCGGIFNFLAALGMAWPVPGADAVFRPDGEPANPQYPLESRGAYKKADQFPVKRLALSGREPLKRLEAAVAWAARNQFDAVVFPFRGNVPPSLAAVYDLGVERGGRELSLLLPRRYFLFRPEMFRMENGKRTWRHHFCVTNPGTIAVIRREAERLFRAHPNTEIFHLWPDPEQERTWCACPSCRAFSPAEQNRIAVNAAAEALAKINPQARLSFYENPGEAIDLELWPNTFALEELPPILTPLSPAPPS